MISLTSRVKSIELQSLGKSTTGLSLSQRIRIREFAKVRYLLQRILKSFVNLIHGAWCNITGDVESQLKIAFIQREHSIKHLPTANLVSVRTSWSSTFLSNFYLCFYLLNITSVNPPGKHWYVAAEMSCTYDSLSSWESPKTCQFVYIVHFVVVGIEISNFSS